MSIISQIKEAFAYLKCKISRFISRYFTNKNDLTEFPKDSTDIKRLLNIMAKRQDELNAKLQRAGELIGMMTDEFTRLKESVQAETDQVAAFMQSLPEDVDTSGLDNVVARLEEAVASSDGMEERVAGIFSTGEATQTVTTNGVTEEKPVDADGNIVSDSGATNENGGSAETPGMTESAANGNASGTDSDVAVGEGAVTGGAPEVADTATPTGTGNVTPEFPASGQEAEATAGGENGTVGNSTGDGMATGPGSDGTDAGGPTVNTTR